MFFMTREERFGLILRKARGDRTQRDVAVACGFFETQICRWEAARGLPTLPHFARLAKELNVDVKAALKVLIGGTK